MLSSDHDSLVLLMFNYFVAIFLCLIFLHLSSLSITILNFCTYIILTVLNLINILHNFHFLH